MSPQNKRLTGIVAAAIFAGAVLGAAGYYAVSVFHSAGPNVNGIPISSEITPVSTTSSVIVGTMSTSTIVAASSSVDGIVPVDMSNWKTYTNYELGFSFQYPPDLTLDASNPSAVVLTFPASYFSTAMADEDIFSVTVSATCTPQESTDDKGDETAAQPINIDGITFQLATQSGVEAGSHDESTTYEVNNNSVCYTIKYYSHGPNSAGAYAADQAQMQSMQTAYGNDVANINAIVGSILSTFTFISTPAGQNEASYSAQQSAVQNGQTSGNGIINLSSLSTTTVSVGGSLTLTGSGFSGHDTIVWISNGSVNGVLWGGMPSSDTSITATIPAQACTQYTGASGAACPSYLILSPGTYTVSVVNQNGATDPVYIKLQ